MARDLSGRHPIGPSALLAIAPRISSAFSSWSSSSPPIRYWHADFPAVSVEHVYVVPTTPQGALIAASETSQRPLCKAAVPQTRYGHAAVSGPGWIRTNDQGIMSPLL